MQLALILLGFLPLTLAHPQQRALLNDFLNLDLVKTATQDLLDILGLEVSEQQCERGCHELVAGPETDLLHTLCIPICRSFQTLVGTFDLRPQTTVAAPAKRFLLEDFDTNVMRNAVQDVVDQVGSDASEQECENYCHNFIVGDSGLLETGCTPLCRSLQTLIQQFNIRPQAAAASAKRAFFADIVDMNLLRNTVQDLVDLVGLDATEEACEVGCHKIIIGSETGLLHTFCTPACRSLQTLANTLNIRPDTTTVAPSV